LELCLPEERDELPLGLFGVATEPPWSGVRQLASQGTAGGNRSTKAGSLLRLGPSRVTVAPRWGADWRARPVGDGCSAAASQACTRSRPQLGEPFFRTKLDRSSSRSRAAVASAQRSIGSVWSAPRPRSALARPAGEPGVASRAGLRDRFRPRGRRARSARSGRAPRAGGRSACGPRHSAPVRS